MAGKKTPEAPKEKKDPVEPKATRPDFTFSAGTSSALIMDQFSVLAEKGEGVSIDACVEACEKAKIKSKNVAGRVKTTLSYAAKGQGGNQVIKVGSLYYVTGTEPSGE